MKRFYLALFLFAASAYSYSHSGQDKFLADYCFKNVRDGIFIDIGAFNGIYDNHTQLFEDLGWKGICVEANPEAFEELKRNRKTNCIQRCIFDGKKTCRFLKVHGEYKRLSGLLEQLKADGLEIINHAIGREGSYEVIDVNCISLNDLLEENKITRVNLLCIDTEGSEIDILFNTDFKKVQIDVINVQNVNPFVATFLSQKGYRSLKTLGSDTIYRRMGRPF